MLPILSPAELEALRLRETVRVVDTRWYMDGRSGEDAHRAGHVPGSVHLDVDRDLAGTGGPGRHPLPSPEAFAATMSGAGIGPDDRVVVYDDDGGSRAARLWFLLVHHGHRGPVQLLDGGFPAWIAAGLPVETGPVSPAPTHYPPTPGTRRFVGKDGVLAAIGESRVLLLDARAGARFRGEVEPVDPRKGHVPGAKSAPYAENLDATGRFLPLESLRARYASLGALSAGEVVVYCGSGVTACHDLFVLDALGVQGTLYEGSFSEWSRDPSLPIETGG